MSAGTFAYGAAAGVGIGVTLVALFIALHRRRLRSVEFSLALLGLSVGLSSIVHLQLQTAATVEEYESILRGPFAVAGLLVLVAFAWVVAIQTRVGWMVAPIALTLGAVIVGVVNFVTDGVIVGEVTALREVSLLGESMVLHEPGRPDARIVLDIYLVILTGYILFALYRRWRTAEPGFGLFVTGMVLAYAALLYDSLVDEAVVDTAYLAPFGVLAFALCVAWQLASRLDELEQRLVDQASQLESVVIVRTEALRDANQQILRELDRQQHVAEHMALLTQHLNAIGVDGEAGAEIESSLAAAVENIGELVGASEVHLEVDDSSSVGAMSLRWLDGPDRRVPDRAEVAWPLRVDGMDLGRLELFMDGGARASEGRQLVALSADYLAVALHRRILAAELVGRAVDDERQRIARDLHDSVSQRLYAAAFNAESLAQRADHDPDLAEAAARVRSLVLMSLAEMRSLLFEIEPDSLSGNTVTNLIAGMCEAMGAAHECRIEVTAVEGPPVDTEVKMALYRIAQEALSNAIRHAEATTIAVTVAVDVAGVVIEVVDDGLGFDSDTLETGRGVHNMSHRAAEIDAVLSITSHPGAGTSVSVTWTAPDDHEHVLDLTGDPDAELAKR